MWMTSVLDIFKRNYTNNYCTFVYAQVSNYIYGPRYNAESQACERRKNTELKKLYHRPNIISYYIFKRLEWFGHVWRVDGQVIKEVIG